MSEFFRRLVYLLNRRRLERELANDMDVHREMAMRDGARFGNALRLREESREAWGWMWLDRCGQDLRYATRVLRRAPGFTLAAVLTLAAGIGVNVAVFGFFDLFALRPLPVRDPDTIVRFHRRAPQNYATHLSYPAMEFYREHSRTLSAVLAVSDSSKLMMEGDGKPIRSRFVTANYLTELGAPVFLGRLFDAAAPHAGDEPVVVLSHAFWQARFGSDPSIVGRTIRLNNKRAVVSGVAAQTFGGLTSGATDVWLPIAQQPHFVDGSRMLMDFSQDAVIMWGRLQPGVTPEMAEEELRSLTGELRKQQPDHTWEGESLGSEPGAYAIAAQGRTSRSTAPPDDRNRIYMVAALGGSLVFLILAVACANLGSLMLARGVAREREIAIRVSVGAGSGRLIRQLFTESLLLALLGSAAGLALGCVAMRWLMAATDAPPWLDPSPDWRIVVFAIAIGFTAAILFGLAPALQVARQRHRATTMRQILLGGQVTASCVLLIVAGLLVRALDRALYSNPGFEYKQVITIDPNLAAHGYAPENAGAYLDTLQGRLRALPGVESVSMASSPPLGRKTTVSSSEVEGRTAAVHINHVDPAFFATMRIPMLRGRTLARGEMQTVVVSESLARRLWPGEDPLGKQLPMNGSKLTITGIAGNARVMALQDPEAVEAYLPAGTPDMPSMTVLVRTSRPPEDVMLGAAGVAKAIDPKMYPATELMRSAFDRHMKGVERSALGVSLLGSLALLLACLGIVGLVAYAVSQRTKEIGIRMALGAEPLQVLVVILRQFSRPVAIGLLTGVGVAAALSQVLRRELYGVSHLDPIAYAAAIAVFLVTAMVAAMVPARRALRVDPVHALRHE